MTKLNRLQQWTEEKTTGQETYSSYAYFLACDFVDRIQEEMDRAGVSKGELAARLGVSAARVSQIIHDPGNLTLELIVRCARVLGMKVTLVTYRDGDPRNERGPIIQDIFTRCWDNAGNPRDMFDLEAECDEYTVVDEEEIVRQPERVSESPTPLSKRTARPVAKQRLSTRKGTSRGRNDR